MHRRLAALLAGAIVVAMTAQVDAETITVCADGCDYTSINAAIAAAADGDIIQLAAETYLEGEEIDTLGKSISILGTTDAEGDPTTVLDGQNAHRILTAVGGTTLVVQDVRFTNGNAWSGDGGGLFAESVTVDVVNCRFKECQGESGGGISLRFADGSTIIFTTFETCVANSTSYSGGGGGTYLDDSAEVNLEFVSFTDC